MENKKCTRGCKYIFGLFKKKIWLQFDDPALEQRYRNVQNQQSSLVIKIAFVVHLIAVLAITVQDCVQRREMNFVISNTTHLAFVVLLLVVSCLTPRFNLYLGYLVVISFFLTNSLIYTFDKFEEALHHHFRGIAIANFFIVFVDGNWILSCIATALPTHFFWALHSDTAGSSLTTMLDINYQFAVFILLTGWGVQAVKRNLFYQRVVMERSSNRWLSFLQCHPDPILVYNQSQDLQFWNDDCTRVLAPELRELELSEQEALKCMKERLLELRVNSYPRNVVLEGSEEDYEP